MKPIDPRTKLLIGIVIIASVFIAENPISIFCQLSIILISVFLFRLPAPFFQSLKLIIPMVGLVFLISWVSYNYYTAFLLCTRLFNLLASSFLIFQHIRPEDLAAALRKMKIPFGFVFMLTTAVRFVPLMQNKIRSIREAQMSRGIDLRFKLKNAKNFMSMLGPLLVQSFILADELAVAMEVRGYGRKNRSFRKDYHLGFVDYIIMWVAVGALIMFIRWETQW
jgi:energy-coupling factor transport system permease protein